MNPSNTVIVVSCYKRPTEWADRLEAMGFEVRRYTKEDPTSMYNVERNAGMEASAYLKYCMDFYDCLPEYTVFLHDEEFSWHHEGSILDRITEALGWQGAFRNLNTHLLPYFYGKYNHSFKTTYDGLLKDSCGPLEQYGEFIGNKLGSAQMIVHKNAILKRPYALYARIYCWLLSYNDIGAHKINGYFMEFVWGILFQDIMPIDYTSIGKMLVYCKEPFTYISNYSYQGIDFIFGEDLKTRDMQRYRWIVYLDDPLHDFNFDMLYTFFLEALKKDSTCDVYDIYGVAIRKVCI
jgi:hypothetical protein